MRFANDGEPLQEVGRTDSIDMPDEALAGHTSFAVTTPMYWKKERPGMYASRKQCQTPTMVTAMAYWAAAWNY